MLCFECDGPAAHQHHVVPRARGGTRTVPLCGECHAKAHDLNGAYPQGWGPRMPEQYAERAARLYGEGMSMHEIAELFNAEGLPTVRGGPWTTSSFTTAFDRLGVKRRKPSGRPPGRSTAPCSKCGGPRPEGFCPPCRRTYNREYGRRRRQKERS